MLLGLLEVPSHIIVLSINRNICGHIIVLSINRYLLLDIICISVNRYLLLDIINAAGTVGGPVAADRGAALQIPAAAQGRDHGQHQQHHHVLWVGAPAAAGHRGLTDLGFATDRELTDVVKGIPVALLLEGEDWDFSISSDVEGGHFPTTDTTKMCMLLRGEQLLGDGKRGELLRYEATMPVGYLYAYRLDTGETMEFNRPFDEFGSRLFMQMTPFTRWKFRLPRAACENRGLAFATASAPDATTLGTQLNLSTTDHPKIDGQTERVNQVLEDMLQAYVNKKQTNWEDYLPILEFTYNSAKHVSTKFSPFMLMYGFQPRSPVIVGLATEKLQHVKDFLQDHMDMLKLTCQNVRQAQDRYKKYADEKRRQVVFKEGDYVFLRVPKDSESLKTGPTPKLLPRFCGPFKILRRVGSMAFKLELPANSRVHPVFHVSR
ncbi:hypothetical protein L7F22_044898 [Adiantum nelumboides]|nr:hypothetical protein [Adiantum nelumboides]